MIKKSGGVNRAKAVAIASVIATTTTLTTCTAIEMYSEYKHEQWVQEQSELRRIRVGMKKVEERILAEKEFEKEVQEKIELNRRIKEEQRIAEEKRQQELQELRNKTGLPVVGFQEYTFELSFYSDLNIENGYGNLTANGETLSNGMIANNFLDFNTMVYFEGYGNKRVTDRGSKKYFNAINKADVFIPRNGGETDGEYYRRVNNMGRRHITGYILELGG